MISLYGPLSHLNTALAIPSALIQMSPYELFARPLSRQIAVLTIPSAVCFPGCDELIRRYRCMFMLPTVSPCELFACPLSPQKAVLVMPSALGLMGPYIPFAHSSSRQTVALTMPSTVFTPESNKPMRRYRRIATPPAMNPCELFALLWLHQKRPLMSPHEQFVHPLPCQKAVLVIPSVVCPPECNEPMRCCRRMAILLTMRPYERFARTLSRQKAALAIPSTVYLPESNKLMW